MSERRANLRRVGAFGIACACSIATAVVESIGLLVLVAVSLPESEPPSENHALLMSAAFWVTAMATGLLTLVLVDVGRWEVWMAPFTAGVLVAVGLVTASAMQDVPPDSSPCRDVCSPRASFWQWGAQGSSSYTE